MAPRSAEKWRLARAVPGDPQAAWREPAEVRWSDRIVVPFTPETRASGIGRTEFLSACWYRGRCEFEPHADGERWMLHLGAVDYAATVWVNGVCVGDHQGGYTPFSFDITELVDGTSAEIAVRAEDDPHDLTQPRGKQDWQLEAHSVWYPRTTGIWQTVWVETVPATRIGRIAFTPDLARWEVGVEAWLEGIRRADVRLATRLRSGSTLLAADAYQVVSGEVHRGVALPDPGSTTRATSCSGVRTRPT